MSSLNASWPSSKRLRRTREPLFSALCGVSLYAIKKHVRIVEHAAVRIAGRIRVLYLSFESSKE